MREDIFYWKCDCPLEVAQKKRLYHADKYARDDLRRAAGEMVRAFCGGAEPPVRPLDVDGNHGVFAFDHGGGRYLLRMDDGLTDDDYLAAESAVMARLSARGLPVPRVHATDAARARWPMRYQVMDRVDAPSLAELHRAGRLDVPAIARASGAFLARLHAERADRAGFFDTEALARDGALRGLDPDCAAYFDKRLDEHLGYVRDHGLLSRDEAGRVERVFAQGRAALAAVRPVLLHRDFAYWNLLGAPDALAAVIDWDDAVGGDPADDLGMVQCFLDAGPMATLLDAYAAAGGGPVDGAFRFRVWMHTLRNMLWKAKLRHQLGYFDKPAGFFLAHNDRGLSLRDYTRAKLRESLAGAEERA